jgi:RES domain-containing protein
VTVLLWRIATEARDYGANDLSGKGAELTGGRWNRPGKPVVYAATSISLACLETVVHLNADGLPLNRYLVQIEVTEAAWAARDMLTVDTAPKGWDALPSGKASLDAGDAWLVSGRSALMLVPSVVVPEELNVLINPLHPQVKGLVARTVRRWTYDGRLR